MFSGSGSLAGQRILGHLRKNRASPVRAKASFRCGGRGARQGQPRKRLTVSGTDIPVALACWMIAVEPLCSPPQITQCRNGGGVRREERCSSTADAGRRDPVGRWALDVVASAARLPTIV